mmetsp:Transcript_22301/g.30795  ORF Transcript_22301/g.30795 Transcript_22301/m.30795 type:complete len:234 (-) Transcript_22301:435-1136(-)
MACSEGTWKWNCSRLYCSPLKLIEKSPTLAGGTFSSQLCALCTRVAVCRGFCAVNFSELSLEPASLVPTMLMGDCSWPSQAGKTVFQSSGPQGLPSSIPQNCLVTLVVAIFSGVSSLGALGFTFSRPITMAVGSTKMDLAVMSPKTMAPALMSTLATLTMLPITLPSISTWFMLSMSPLTIPVGPMIRSPVDSRSPENLPSIFKRVSNSRSPLKLTLGPMVVSGTSLLRSFLT